jgi:hypothetical protein
MNSTMKDIKEGRGLLPLDKTNANLAMNYGDARNGFQPTEPEKKHKRKVILEAYIQTSYEQWTHMYKTAEIELPDDGNEWHVAGEVYE